MVVWDRVSTPFVLSRLLFGNKEDVCSSGKEMDIVIAFRSRCIQNLDWPEAPDKKLLDRKANSHRLKLLISHTLQTEGKQNCCLMSL